MRFLYIDYQELFFKAYEHFFKKKLQGHIMYSFNRSGEHTFGGNFVFLKHNIVPSSILKDKRSFPKILNFLQPLTNKPETLSEVTNY